MLSQEQICPYFMYAILCISFRDIYWWCMYIYVPNMNSPGSTKWPGTQYTYFSSYISCYSHTTEQIWLPHCKYLSICCILYWHKGATLVHIYAKTQPNTYLLCVIVLFIPESNMSARLHIYVIYLKGIYGNCLCICVSHIKSLSSTIWPAVWYTNNAATDTN